MTTENGLQLKSNGKLTTVRNYHAEKTSLETFIITFEVDSFFGQTRRFKLDSATETIDARTLNALGFEVVAPAQVVPFRHSTFTEDCGCVVSFKDAIVERMCDGCVDIQAERDYLFAAA